MGSRIFQTENLNISTKTKLSAKLLSQKSGVQVGWIHRTNNSKKSRDTATLMFQFFGNGIAMEDFLNTVQYSNVPVLGKYRYSLCLCFLSHSWDTVLYTIYCTVWQYGTVLNIQHVQWVFQNNKFRMDFLLCLTKRS